MFIMKDNIHFVLLLLILLSACAEVEAQDIDNESMIVKPIKDTKLRPLLVDVWFYGAGSYKSHSNLWTANNHSFGSRSLYDTFVDVGIETEVHRDGLLRIGGGLGYKYEHYAYDPGFSSNEGVNSHWLSTSINASYWFFNGGLLSDVYLGSSVKNSDYLSYEGIYGDCFNRTSFGIYVGSFFMFTRMKIEGRIGSYFKTQLNPDKIARHNLYDCYVSGFFWEIKMSYRLFTSGKHFNNSLMIEK